MVMRMTMNCSWIVRYRRIYYAMNYIGTYRIYGIVGYCGPDSIDTVSHYL